LLSYGRGVYVKYYSIAFAILPGIAGGLALELLKACLKSSNALWNQVRMSWSQDLANFALKIKPNAGVEILPPVRI
jgi:hypothetical protein